MSEAKDKRLLENLRRDVVATVRDLRTGRKLPQAELAALLGMSQSRLSEVERGHGSFTAEQFLVLLRLFNVPVSDFDRRTALDRTAQLQNALARLGASHLRETDTVLPSEELHEVRGAIREALIDGTSRLVTATAPVLVLHIDRAGLTRLDFELRAAGLERRLAWLADNVIEAISLERTPSRDREWAQRYARAEVVLATFLDSAGRVPNEDAPLDVLDPQIRSTRTVSEVKARRSPASRRWGIVTRLRPEDFARALEEARAGR
jgi:transcriptional regulator with XRE-family HTH domain